MLQSMGLQGVGHDWATSLHLRHHYHHLVVASNNCRQIVAVKSLNDPLYCNSPGSSVHGISQARILEWVPIIFFKGSY